jgi:hypothetical protein
MKLAPLHDRFCEAFFRWGWLTPAVLPLTQLGGRGLFNTLVYLYALWGLFSVWGRRARFDQPVVLLYLALLGVFLLTILARSIRSGDYALGLALLSKAAFCC